MKRAQLQNDSGYERRMGMKNTLIRTPLACTDLRESKYFIRIVYKRGAANGACEEYERRVA